MPVMMLKVVTTNNYVHRLYSTSNVCWCYYTDLYTFSFVANSVSNLNSQSQFSMRLHAINMPVSVTVSFLGLCIATT